MNVSSIVIKTSPEHLKDVLGSLNSSDFCEIHFHDKLGRIIVTIEGVNVDEEMKKLKLLQKTDRVLSAEMVYSYSEGEPEKG
jgi:nitrate reductase NapD